MPWVVSFSAFGPASWVMRNSWRASTSGPWSQRERLRGKEKEAVWGEGPDDGRFGTDMPWVWAWEMRDWSFDWSRAIVASREEGDGGGEDELVLLPDAWLTGFPARL